MAPALNAVQLATLQARITQEVAFCNANGGNPNDPTDPASDVSKGTTCLRSEVDDTNDFTDRLMEDWSIPYTLEEGRTAKRQKNLSGPSDNDADIFLRTSNPQQHLYQMILVMLQCKDMLHTLMADAQKKYKLSDTLAKTCLDYPHCALLSPKAKNYCNIKDQQTIAATILAVMRELGVADLPASMETGCVDVLLKFSNKALTTKHYHIKYHLFASLIGDEKVDLATLTRSCIGTSPAVPTAALYQHIALLRSIALKFKNSGKTTDIDDAKDNSKDKFWPEVDSRLATYHQMTPGNRQVLYEMAYREDIATHGETDKTIPITLMQNVESWLQTLSTAMEK
ncbi:hypothetical protein C8F04DRAFT_1365746 [Mycena alexandri]|uniref:Uncharacterized protein n=1 Tax=Mycena alexandri TaxID=1745969 RepID=A0AAD6WZ28_9AGAR|nr:hypothetical protein C8F04DRAFT_1365746 [Mycena alexandri]